MSLMRRLVFLGVILGVIVLSVGCQQSGLSEGRVRDIVEEEVARRLATMDDLTISRLWFANDDGDILGMLGVIDNKLTLTMDNAEGVPVVGLGSVDGEGYLILRSADGGVAVLIGSSSDGGALLTIYNADENAVITIGSSSDGNGMLFIEDKDGQVTFVAP